MFAQRGLFEIRRDGESKERANRGSAPERRALLRLSQALRIRSGSVRPPQGSSQRTGSDTVHCAAAGTAARDTGKTEGGRSAPRSDGLKKRTSIRTHKEP